MNDTELLQQFSGGSHEAFEIVYSSYRRWLLVVAMSILRQEQEAEEVVQEFFTDLWQLKLYENISVASIESFKSYLFVSIKNRCMNKLERDDTRRKRMSRLLQPEEPGMPNRNIENTELKKQLEQAIAQLPPRQSTVFQMAYLQYKSQKEIAQEMDISVLTVKKQMSLALKSLRQQLKNLD